MQLYTTKSQHFLTLIALSVLMLLTLTAPSLHGRTPPAPDLLQFSSGGQVLGFAANAAYVAGGAHAYRVEFANANAIAPTAATALGEKGQASPLSRVTYSNLWDGITLSYDAPAGALLRSTYRVEPQADPAQIRLRYNAPAQIARDGTLTLAYETGEMRESAPVAWQEIDGAHVPVAVAFQTFDSSTARFASVGFRLGAYDSAYPLFIDPTLTWNTFLGGVGDDYGRDIAVDESGNIYVVGYGNASWGSPVRPYTAGDDAFVAKLNSNGGLIWHTFLGGSGEDFGRGIAVDGSGNVYVTGWSDATWGSPVRPYTADNDTFAAKLNSSGALTWHTFLGGFGSDLGTSITVDESDSVYVTGLSGASWGTPVLPYTAGSDGFAAKLTSSGGVVWNSFLGGNGSDSGQDIVVDGSGNVYVVGWGDATWGSPVRPYTDNDEAFVVKLNSIGALTWNTFLGGNGNDNGFGIAVDGSGKMYVAGVSNTTWGSPIRPYTANLDGFAAQLDSNGALTWNTFLGGSGDDYGEDITLDGSGRLYVAGTSDASWGSPFRPYTAADDAFAAGLTSSGVLFGSTFLGGSLYDEGHDIAVDGSGQVYVTGNSYGTWGSPVNGYTNEYDVFVAKLSLLYSLYLPVVIRQ